MKWMSLFSALPIVLALMSSSQSVRPAKSTGALKLMTACAAVTKAEIEEALGHVLEGGKERVEGAGSTCDYPGGNGQVTIALRHSPVKLNVAQEVETLKKAIPEATLRETAGIGTRAFLLQIPESGVQLHVLCGDFDYLLVSVLGFGESPEVATAAEKVARKALSRL